MSKKRLRERTEEATVRNVAINQRVYLCVCADQQQGKKGDMLFLFLLSIVQSREYFAPWGGSAIFAPSELGRKTAHNLSKKGYQWKGSADESTGEMCVCGDKRQQQQQQQQLRKSRRRRRPFCSTS